MNWRGQQLNTMYNTTRLAYSNTSKFGTNIHALDEASFSSFYIWTLVACHCISVITVQDNVHSAQLFIFISVTPALIVMLHVVGQVWGLVCIRPMYHCISVSLLVSQHQSRCFLTLLGHWQLRGEGGAGGWSRSWCCYCMHSFTPCANTDTLLFISHAYRVNVNTSWS